MKKFVGSFNVYLEQKLARRIDIEKFKEEIKIINLGKQHKSFFREIDKYNIKGTLLYYVENGSGAFLTDNKGKILIIFKCHLELEKVINLIEKCRLGE